MLAAASRKNPDSPVDFVLFFLGGEGERDRSAGLGQPGRTKTNKLHSLTPAACGQVPTGLRKSGAHCV